MDKEEIIKQAIHYFGKDRVSLRKLLKTYVFDGKEYKKWGDEIKSIISQPFEVRYSIFDEVVLWVQGDRTYPINWHWVGDLSWSIEIVLNPGIDDYNDGYKDLAIQCNGKARILTVFICDIIPCYTYGFNYTAYSKEGNYIEYGPLEDVTEEEKAILKRVTTLLNKRGFTYLNASFLSKKYEALYSDIHSGGNARLYEALFSDAKYLPEQIGRYSDEEIIEEGGTRFRWRDYYHKNGKLEQRHEYRYAEDGTEFHWSEYYNKNGALQKRIEKRKLKSGDYMELTLDSKGRIVNVEITRKKIGRKELQRFELNVDKAFAESSAK